ncbi:MAG TPA: malto-oligosyltrehalose synthase [Steroidobacteraceae bacterium]|nr:malto-oligosyltrehalose synthase [Steroidobacteraceae bacterium]
MPPPRATYRLQFSRDFGFRDAARVAPYLAQLGISHVYASSWLRARPGSTHGYDIVAHDELNPELGSLEDFRTMTAEFARCGLATLLDFVPNHMGVHGADNPLWLDVLEWGPESRFAGWFDIDWEPAAGYLAEKLLIPVLGDQYGAVLAAGELELKFDAHTGEFAVWAYGTHKLPVHPLHYGLVLGTDHPALERLGDDFATLLQWRPQVRRRADELKADLAQLVARDPTAAAWIDATLRRHNHDDQRAALDALIRRQYWRASHFRVAGDDINYRRFFNINDLAGLRIELPEVFEHAHRLVARLLRDGAIDGLRIDHVDGLLDPGEYLARVRALALDPQGASRPFYLVVEKILARDETLPRDWQVDGTTGYEFANLVLRTLTDGAGSAALTRAWRAASGDTQPFAALVRDCKHRILNNEMASELNVLARDTARLARQNARTADFTRNLLRRAIRETIACFPVYRTYVDGRTGTGDADRERIERAIAQARGHERDVDPSVFDFLESLLTGDLVAAPRSGFSRQAALRCAMKFQQLSGPVMAKGLEDTAFYLFNRLISHNEVGGDPATLSGTPDEFHDANRQRLRATPHSLLATSTHDTKRGEDVRARLAVLAEMPEEWSELVVEWRAHVSTHSEALDDRGLEYLLWQTLVGSWPEAGDAHHADAGIDDYKRRIHQALIKSAREARAFTSWASPDTGYEASLRALIDAVFASRELRASLERCVARVAAAGRRNGLVQTVLKLTAPGVPDIYQGTELWDLTLVDPDNRRPVDYAHRAALLAGLLDSWRADPVGTLRRALADQRSGGVKLLTIAVLLAHRRDFPALFASGDYRALELPAPLVGFDREDGAARLRVICRRFPLKAEEDLPLALPASATAWRNLLTGRDLAATTSFEAAAGGLPFIVAV